MTDLSGNYDPAADEDPRDDPDHDVDRPSGSALVAERRDVVRSLRIPFEPQEEFTIALDELRHSAIKGRGRPQPGIRLLAPSYSGKSTAALAYQRSVEARGEHEPGTMPVVYVKLDSEGSVGSLAADLLRGMRQPRPNSLTPPNRWDRARRKLRDLDVQLIVFDEFQRAGRRPTVHPVIAGKIMDIMDDEEGSCACAFIGKTTAKNIFKASSDLGNRLDAPVQMGKLIWSHDKDLFTKFAKTFDEGLRSGGATKVLSGLDDPLIAELLLESANGLIGQFSRIVETAVMAITRRGQDGITAKDLEEAVDEWSIGNDRISYNPFRKTR